MINALTPDNFKNIYKATILDARKVFYPLKYVLEKRDITYDEDLAVEIKLIAENIKYPSSSKMTDAGMLRSYKIDFDINNQSVVTETKLESLQNRKIILILHHPQGHIIFGCNEMPLQFLFDDDNSSSPQKDSGFLVSCTGNAYFLKVSL